METLDPDPEWIWVRELKSWIRIRIEANVDLKHTYLNRNSNGVSWDGVLCPKKSIG
jgi:hypothetical protein